MRDWGRVVPVYLLLLARLALGGTWVASSAAKLSTRASMEDAVAAFRLLPRPAARAVGAALPWVELGLGGLLLLGLATTPAALASLALLALFSAAIAVNLLRGERPVCRCFGAWSAGRISWWSVARNVGLAALALAVVAWPSAFLSADRWWRGGALLEPGDPPAEDLVPLLLLVAAAGLAWLVLGSAYGAANAIARAESGPASGSPAQARLRRLLRLGPRGGAAGDLPVLEGR